MNIFRGIKKLWIFLGVITKLDYFYRSYLYCFGLFLKLKVQNWNIFGVAKFQIFLGMPDIPEFIW